MSIKKLSAALILTFTTAAAADYRTEIRAAYFDSDKQESTALAGKFHFRPVETASHPLAEAAFLERSSNISLSHTRNEFGPTNTDTAVAVVALYIPQAMLYIAPIYVRASSKLYDYSASQSEWGVAVGITPIEGFRLSTTYADEVDYETNFEIKYLLSFANNTAINMEFGYADASTPYMSDTISRAVDFYFDRTFNVGIEMISKGTTTHAISTEKFFTETFSGYASYRKGYNDEGWIIGASMRF